MNEDKILEYYSLYSKMKQLADSCEVTNTIRCTERYAFVHNVSVSMGKVREKLKERKDACNKDCK